ncbi:MAG: hypothetical protein NTV86_16390 [Planctomycetota bacterium]|nr:hypothetical protein [Planctomycetota bacterium]
MGDFTESAAPSENSPAPASPAAPATPPRPRRRLPRWLRWTCIVLGILLVLIAVAPYVVAPLWGPAIVSAIGRSQIKGSLTVRKVSLSWFSPITVEGIRLAHPDGTSVLEVESVRLESGLLGAALHAQKFGRVDIHRPHVRLERGSSGQFTIAEALEPRHPSAPHEKKRAGEKGAQPAGRVVVTDAEFEYCHPDGTSVLTAGLNVDSRLDSLNDIRVTVRAATGRGGDLICELAVRDLMPEGQVNLDKAVATVAFSTSSPVDLTDLAGAADARACLYCVYRSLCERGTRAGDVARSGDAARRATPGECPSRLTGDGKTTTCGPSSPWAWTTWPPRAPSR